MKKIQQLYKNVGADIDAMEKIMANYMDNKAEIMKYTDDITAKSEQIMDNISGMIKDSSGEQIKVDDWEQKSEKFYNALSKIISSKVHKDIKKITLDLTSVKEMYEETNNAIILSNVVPKFEKLISAAEKSHQMQSIIHKKMEEIKKNYLNHAPAEALIKGLNTTAIFQANAESVENLISIKHYLENYRKSDNKEGWRKYMQGGGSKTKTEIA